MHIGVFGHGTFIQTGGTVNIPNGSGYFSLGDYPYATSQGVGTMSGGSLNTPNFTMSRQTLASGTFTQSGGMVNIGVNGLQICGVNAGTTGTFNGTYNMQVGTLTDAGSFVIGNTGSSPPPSPIASSIKAAARWIRPRGGITTNARSPGTLALSGGTLNLGGNSLSGVNFQFSGAR